MREDAQALIIYPQAGEANTAIRRSHRARILDHTYESDPAKEKRSRAATTIRRYIKANNLSLLITNTFAVEVKSEEAMNISNYWIRKLRERVFCNPFPYVKVLEGIPEGERVHIHALLPFVPYHEIASTWNRGSIDIKCFPRTSSGLVSKYLAKTVADNTIHRKRGFTTGAGFKPIRHVLYIDNQDPVSILQHEVGLKNIVCVQDDYGFVGGGRYEFEASIR